jgi:CBS domain-containing protein
MQVKDVMTGTVEVLAPTATLRECAERMRDLDVGCMPIREKRKIVGVVTDRDVVVRAIADGMDPARTRVQQIMSGDVVTCYEDDDVSDAAEMMEQNQIRRILVLSKELVGILALGDLAVGVGDEELTGEVLERVSSPAQPALHG